MFCQAQAYAAAAAAIAAVTLAAPAVAAPITPNPSITPGAGVAIYDSSKALAAGCTLGFLATDTDGNHYAFTAGHCTHDGNVLMPYKEQGNFQRVGKFTESVDAPTWPDIAAIKLDSSMPLDNRVLSRRPVTGVTSNINTADTLCFYGMSTGRQCGQVTATAAGDDHVWFDATPAQGDSGAPVYRIGQDGSATAVGILKGGSDQGGASATLLEPFLKKWNLTLDTTRSPVAAPVGYQPSR